MAIIHDPASLEVGKNSLESIAEGMALTVVRTARSFIVRHSMDFSTGVLNARGELIAQGQCIPAHLGGMPAALAACLNRYSQDIFPGDILAVNDPYEGGSHLPDIFLYKPVFVGDRIVSYLCAMTHHQDIGGRVAGGNACDSTEIYQEGLRIPPVKLYHQGRPNETLFRILEKAVRVPEIVLGDILSNVAALDFGERELVKLVQKYGVEDMESLTDQLLDYTELLTRNAIRSLPDGTWTFTDYIDDDGFGQGPIAIVTTLTKKADELHVDFAGTSPQCKGSIQPVFATTKAMVYAVVRCVLGSQGYDVPNTQGYFRPVHVTAPEGCFVNPRIPAAVAARGLSLERIAQSVFGAFAQALPDSIPACAGGAETGVSMSGYAKTRIPWKPWVLMDFQVETARGGAPTGDGPDAHFSGIFSVANIPAEEMEISFPVKLTQYALAPDSEGAGKFRGGLGITREWEYQMDETVVQVRSDRQQHAPYGLQGGQSASSSKIAFNPNTSDERQMPSKFMWTAHRGDTMRITASGAGGWGNPLDRDPEMVLQDVIAEKITAERAMHVYGVAIDTRKRIVDHPTTANLRHALSQH